MRASVPIIAAAILSSCSYPPAPPGVALARETAGLVAGPPQSCIASMPDQALRIVDEQTLAYGWGQSIAVNHLSAPCPGLEPANTLIVEPGLPGQYCRGDRVRVIEAGSRIPGAACVLGDWTPYRRP